MFTAVLPPQQLIEQLDELLRPRRDSDDRLRWTKPSGWHLTTAFMADVPDVERLIEALGQFAATTQPFGLRVAGSLAFPNPVEARALALGVTLGEDRLAGLAEKSRHAANRAGAAPEGGRFTGHLTLARANRPIQATKWLGVFDSFPGWTFDVTELALIQSHEVGKRYEVVETFPLAGFPGLRGTTDQLVTDELGD